MMKSHHGVIASSVSVGDLPTAQWNATGQNYNNLDNVSSWVDTGVSGILPFGQTTGSFQPVWYSSVDSLAAVRLASNDWMIAPASSDFIFGTGDFTIEFWIKFNTLSAEQCLMSHRGNGVNTDSAATRWDMRATTSSLQINAYRGGAEVLAQTASTTLTTGTWYHIALCRDGANVRIFQAGALLDTWNIGAGATWPDSPYNLCIGAILYTSNRILHVQDAYYDDIRINKGLAKYTTGFTPAART